eukprot:m.150980 g.150980  ORF g.150980 m.150980 type:complete len:169 (-) comp23341_c0_seq1:510-1016(-)
MDGQSTPKQRAGSITLQSPQMPDDVLPDRFPVQAAAVPLSDSLRTISGIRRWSSSHKASSSLAATPSPLPRWMRQIAGLSASASPASSIESIDGRDPLSPSSPLKTHAYHGKEADDFRPTSPNRYFSALDLTSFEQMDSRSTFDVQLAEFGSAYDLSSNESSLSNKSH